jgi:hypothetical protein
MFGVLKELKAFPTDGLPRAMADFERALHYSIKKNIPWANVSTFFSWLCFIRLL